LEEPPARGVLLLVSHSPGRLLPTIRSRCRRLAFHALPEDEVAAFVQARSGANAEDAIRLSRMANGAPGRAVALYAAGAVAIDDAAREILLNLPKLDEGMALALADRFRGGEGQQQFSLLIERLAERVHGHLRHQAAQGFGGLDRWASAWETLQRLPREVEAVNLDRADAFFSALSELRAAARV